MIDSLYQNIIYQHLAVTIADKGSTVVLMDCLDYDTKMNECLALINAKIDPQFNFDAYINGGRHLSYKESLEPILFLTHLPLAFMAYLYSI